MRHANANRKFGRKSGQRKALLRSLAENLVIHGQIKTTEAKAKELRPYVEKLVTLGKKDSLATKKLLVSRVGKIAAKKITGDLSKSYLERRGGYTRITKMVRRSSDGAKMAVIEFVK